jgi:hypothetical protein
MKFYALKRILPNEDGSKDISFIPAFKQDIVNAQNNKKMPPNTMIEFNVKVDRNPESNGKLWSLCSFVVENLPERYWHDGKPEFPSKELLYEWLKIEVGFCDVIFHNGSTVKIPKETKFDKLEDENDYLEKFHNPAVEYLALMMDMSISDLYISSQEWRKEKTATKLWNNN